MIQQFPIRMVSARMIAPSVRLLRCARVDGAPLAYIPGQFLQLHFHDANGKACRRNYSIATMANDPAQGVGEFEFAISYVDGGAGTQLLSQLQIGDTVMATGPNGRFCLMPEDTNTRYLMVATGTGASTYRSMLPQLRGLMDTRRLQVELIFGVRHADDLLYGEEFDAFAREHANFRFHPCFSRRARTPAGAHDRAGRVQGALDVLQPDPTTDIVYLCGNPAMVDDCFKHLGEQGFTLAQLRRERYVSLK